MLPIFMLEGFVPNIIKYYERGKLVQEKVEYSRVLKFLYSSWLGSVVWWFLSRRIVIFLIAGYYKSRLSCRLIKPFVKKHSIIINDYLKKIDDYSSFNDFFIRCLKPGVRCIDKEESVCIAPADSKVLAYEQVSSTMKFYVKNLPFDIGSFLGGGCMSGAYTNGAMCIFRLAPYDYHRFHFPLSGMPLAIKEIVGSYHSVNPLVYSHGLQPLTRNKRIVIPLKTELFGNVLVVPVGALFVGNIVLTYKDSGRVNKGDEAGYFEFGGSTVVLLFEQGRVSFKQELLANTKEGFETAVEVGHAIAYVS